MRQRRNMGLISRGGERLIQSVQSLVDEQGGCGKHGPSRSGSRSSLPNGTFRGVVACAAAEANSNHGVGEMMRSSPRGS
jgi:hypothetical protein